MPSFDSTASRAKQFLKSGIAIAFALLTISLTPAAHAEVVQTLQPINLAQAQFTPSLTPTDITPTPIGTERSLLKPGPKYYLYQKLPSRLWFNLSAETSQRYESNVFFRASHPQSDYVYRVLPNMTLGYNLFGHTSIYTNYFVIKDLFVGHSQLSFPTTQSLSLGLRHEKTLGTKTNLQFDFQARELWQTTGLHQADLIPGVTVTRVLTPKTIAFFNTLLQMRGKYYFVAPTRELDPFWTLGVLHSKGNWVFSGVGTLVCNFRHEPFSNPIPYYGNESIILDFEVSHPVTKKIPGLVAFVRAEPIFNWNSHSTPGISGFDFRLFSGLRFTLVKPSYNSQIDKLRKQLMESDALPANRQSNGMPNMTDPNVGPNSPGPGAPIEQPAAPSVSPSAPITPAPASFNNIPSVEDQMMHTTPIDGASVPSPSTPINGASLPTSTTPILDAAVNAPLAPARVASTN